MNAFEETLKIKLYFSELVPPDLKEIVFYGKKEKRYRQKIESSEKGDFRWMAGTMGVVLAFLDFKLNGQKNGRFYNFAHLSADSACGVIDKLGWLQGAFGFIGDTDKEIAKQVFKGGKDRECFKIDSNRLFPENIQVFGPGLNQPLLIPEIKQLYSAIERLWDSNYKGTRRQVMRDKVIQSKPITSREYYLDQMTRASA